MFGLSKTPWFLGSCMSLSSKAARYFGIWAIKYAFVITVAVIIVAMSVVVIIAVGVMVVAVTAVIESVEPCD